MGIKFFLSAPEMLPLFFAIHVYIYLNSIRACSPKFKKNSHTNPKTSISYVGILMHCLSSMRFKT
jgi:hypothetical protein